MINRTVLVGRLTKDPDLRKTGTGIAVATFTLAVNRTFKTDNGPEADFVPVVVWRKQAENVAQYVGKGSLVGVEGRLQTRTYEAQDGGTRFIMEVVADSVQFLDNRSNTHTNQGQAAVPTQQQSNGLQSQARNQNVDFSFNADPTYEINDDDLPF